MTPRIPFMLVGDGPSEPSGLGRIARDLSGLLSTSDLPLDLVQVGGSIPPLFTAGWRHLPLSMGEQWDWGATCVKSYWHDLWGDQPGVLFVVWDPGRLLPYAQIDLPVQRWTYTAIDGANVHGQISGPARAALEGFDRILAYGRYGAEVLKLSLGRDIPYLPHGLLPQVYAEPATPTEQKWANAVLGPFCPASAKVVGCVATNQWRKDLGIYFHSLRALLDRGHRVFGWLHTDTAVKAWSVQQLVEDFGLAKACRITIQDFSDRQLAVMYQACSAVILPSLGEGFGYPLVEALASGTPVVASDIAGGAELVPKGEWRVPNRSWRLEGIYALRRPVYEAADWANAIERAWQWREQAGEATARAYCTGSIAHLDWSALWPRWRSFFKQGLQL